MKKITFADHMRYQFDNLMSKGPIALIGGLAVISIILVLIISAIGVIIKVDPGNGEPLSFVEVAWASLMRTLDAGTMGADEGWIFRILMLVITIGGIFVVSSLIGVLTTGLESKLDDLRKGRSFVVESNHTAILGWNSQIFNVLSELISANANQRQACIAILADKDKVEMEDEIRSKVESPSRIHIVCRTGNPLDLVDLEIVNPHSSRSIIILPPETEDADSQIIKTILALTNNPNRRSEPYHIVTAIRDEKNMEAAHLVGKNEAEIVLVDTLVSRMIAQTCRQSGLSIAYTELLDFGGDEIYFHEEPRLVGKSFGEALVAYEDSAVIGLCYKNGRVALNPGIEVTIQDGDQIIAISEDDDTVRLTSISPSIDTALICNGEKRQDIPERTLILGWNRRAAGVVQELDNYVPPGSEITVVSDEETDGEKLREQCSKLKNQKVIFIHGATASRGFLDSLNVVAFSHVIVLSYSDTLQPEQADARTLITLLHLREIADQTGSNLSIVSEMMDSRNRQLAEVTRADDFIISDKMVSLLMTQIAENKLLAPVFNDLFDPEGSELYLKPIEDYVTTGKAVNFYTVVESGCRQGGIVIGYRIAAEENDPKKSYGVHINPNKSEKITFAAGDMVIILSED